MCLDIVCVEGGFSQIRSHIGFIVAVDMNDRCKICGGSEGSVTNRYALSLGKLITI